MRIRLIDTYTHPKHGKMYLWNSGEYQYYLGNVSTKHMGFDGFTLDEVTSKVKKEGFTRVELKPSK